MHWNQHNWRDWTLININRKFNSSAIQNHILTNISRIFITVKHSRLLFGCFYMLISLFIFLIWQNYVKNVENANKWFFLIWLNAELTNFFAAYWPFQRNTPTVKSLYRRSPISKPSMSSCRGEDFEKLNCITTNAFLVFLFNDKWEKLLMHLNKY